MRRQGPQQIGGRFKLTLLGCKPFDDNRHGFPVEITKVGIFPQLRKDREALLEGGLFLLQRADATGKVGKVRFLSLGILFQGRDFFGVAPAKDITPPIIYSMPVILFMPLPGCLDLSDLGNGPGLAAELFLVLAAGEIKAVVTIRSTSNLLAGFR